MIVVPTIQRIYDWYESQKITVIGSTYGKELTLRIETEDQIHEWKYGIFSTPRNREWAKVKELPRNIVTERVRQAKVAK